jgi:glycosyltransferase involved in cell wall biosynthesis
MTKVLCIMQLPPPVHGVSVMNSYIASSDLIKASFVLEVVDLTFGRSITELEKISFLKVFKALRFGFLIGKKMITFKPGLVYFTLAPTGFAFYRDAFYVCILKIFNPKIILHLHGKGIKKNVSHSLLKRNIYRFVFRKTSVICLSDKLSKDIADVYNPPPFIVPNGIAAYNGIGMAKASEDSAIPQILYFSNYILNKGILILVEALGILKRKGHHFNVRLVGAPYNVSIQDLEQAILKQGLTDVTTIVGPLYGDAKYVEFQKADLFVFPTYNDAFPLVTIEAMQFGLPVVSTFEGSIPDIVVNQETGLLVEPENVEKLADSIGNLLEDKQARVSMGVKGFERYKNNFTLEHFEVNLHEIFKRILGSGQPHSDSRHSREVLVKHQ